MPSYASSAELTAEIRRRAKLFAAEFEGIPEGSWDDVPEGADRSPRQMIAYQLEWMDLLLGWERDEQAGLDVVTPAPGFKWNRLGGLCEGFYAAWAEASPKELAAAFDERVDAVCDWAASLSESDLFGEQRRAWASFTPSAWPVWKWIHINTVAPLYNVSRQGQKMEKGRRRRLTGQTARALTRENRRGRSPGSWRRRRRACASRRRKWSRSDCA